MLYCEFFEVKPSEERAAPHCELQTRERTFCQLTFTMETESTVSGSNHHPL